MSVVVSVVNTLDNTPHFSATLGKHADEQCYTEPNHHYVELKLLGTGSGCKFIFSCMRMRPNASGENPALEFVSAYLIGSFINRRAKRVR